MKQQHNSRYAIQSIILLFSLYCFAACTATKHPVPVTGASEEEVKQAIADDRWIFLANQAIPQSGRSQILTTRYTVYLNKDTLQSALPYFGRAYTATIGETTSPLDFRSTNFTITKNEDKKGRWKITIKPGDNRDVQSYSFTFFTNGSAQLNVQMATRSAISFNGTLAPVK